MVVAYLAHAFDLLNVGDLDVIAQARAQCSRLVVGVLSDEAVERSTGRPPVVPLGERLALVGHLRGVDEFLVHDEAALDRTRPDVVFTAGRSLGAEGLTGATMLRPLRDTSSDVLRQALDSAPAEAAA